MDKGWLLLRADQYTKLAAGCSRNNATHFFALAQYYRTWAHEVDKDSQESELLRVGKCEWPIFRLTGLMLCWLQLLTNCATSAILFSSQVPLRRRQN
jgi:hypothetical protein